MSPKSMLRSCLFVLIVMAALDAFASQAGENESLEVLRAQEIIRKVYLDVLGRDADSSGLTTYTRSLVEDGRDEAWLRKVLSQSREKKAPRVQLWKRVKSRAPWLFLVAGFMGFGLLCRKKPALARLSMKGLFALLFTGVLAEMALRSYDRVKPSYIFYDSTYNRYRGRPHASDVDFTLNSRGFKDEEFTEEKTKTFRILGLGDSFAYGVVPYRYHYYTLLEEHLRQAGLDAEVLNMGIPSIGPADYRNLFIAEGLELNPDMVIVSFFVGNDFADAVIADKRRKWYEYSHAATFLYYLVKVRPDYAGRRDYAQTYHDDSCTFKEFPFHKIQLKRSYIFRAGDEKFHSHLDAALRYLADIQKLCRRRGLELLVVVIPDETQVSAELQDMITRRYSEVARDQWDWSQPNTRLCAALDTLEISHIDLLGAFQEGSKVELLYKPRDTHWNIAGNALAARVIAGHIMQQARLPGPAN